MSQTDVTDRLTNSTNINIDYYWKWKYESKSFESKNKKCRICDYPATQKGDLSRHIKNVHQKSENINCSECNQYVQKVNLKRHIKVFHSGEQTLYNCKVCTFQSIHQYALNRHVRKVHQKSANQEFALHCIKARAKLWYK